MVIAGVKTFWKFEVFDRTFRASQKKVAAATKAKQQSFTKNFHLCCFIWKKRASNMETTVIAHTHTLTHSLSHRHPHTHIFTLLASTHPNSLPQRALFLSHPHVHTYAHNTSFLPTCNTCSLMLPLLLLQQVHWPSVHDSNELSSLSFFVRVCVCQSVHSVQMCISLDWYVSLSLWFVSF